MNPILTQIQELITANLREHLPDVTPADLEEGGEVYYMNGKNGTEFDWYVNCHLPCFMVFYADKDNLGAAKLSLYDDGGVLLYLYGDHGRGSAKEVKTYIECEPDDLLKLAVVLRVNADDKRIWDASIEKIETDGSPSAEELAEFTDDYKYYEKSINRKAIMGQLCVASRKIIDDGYLVGYMTRGEPHDDQDSGWEFYAGDESDEYLDDVKNVCLCYVNYVCGLDQVVTGYVDSEVGSRLVRVKRERLSEESGEGVDGVAEDVFEEDKGQKGIVGKRK